MSTRPTRRLRPAMLRRLAAVTVVPRAILRRPFTSVALLGFVPFTAVLACTPTAAAGQRPDTTTAVPPVRPAAPDSTDAPACCTIVRLDDGSAVVTARETATGYTFRFQVKNRRLRASLKVGHPVWADFGSGTVRLERVAPEPCCAITRTAPPHAPTASGDSGDADHEPPSRPHTPLPSRESSTCAR